MLTTFMGLYTAYVLITIYVSVMQIAYINQTKRNEPILLKRADFLKAGNYSVAKEKLKIVNTFLEFVLFMTWLSVGIQYLETTFIVFEPLYKTLSVVLGFVIINAIIGMPFEWYSKFVLDEKFGFNKSTIKLYIKDTLITFALSIVFGSAVIIGLYFIMISAPMWWLHSFLFIFSVIILINMLFPTVRALFFDKVTLLDDAELNTKIEKIMDETGFVSSGVYVSDASKRDGRLNAYFGGLGKSKRVVLFDTLIEKLTHQELLAVLGHELGHFAHGDLYKNIAMVGAMLFGMFALFGNLSETLFLELGVSNSPSVIMILFMLFMPLLSFVMMPIMGVVSRHNEYEADKMGAQLGGQLFLAEALKKLVTENKSYPLSHPLYIFFYYTHPPVLERLKELGVDIKTLEDSGLKSEDPLQDELT
jgi:STE24 endopeptidase